MPDHPLPPLRFEPILKRHLWGGRRLGKVLDKPIGEEGDYAESWEISDHHDDVSIVADGPLAGTSLRDLIRTRCRELLGPALEGATEFPLLVKFIDAHQNLSVQVHPDDEQAKRLADDNGKTEAWVVLDSEPGSLIYAGLEAGVTPKAFSDAIEKGTIVDLIYTIKADPGDCILIPAGTVHAIGAGVLLVEIQQMSDTTFRVFDWNRTGPDGKPRTLHIKEALEVIDFSRGPVEPWKGEETPIEGGGTRKPLASCPHFALEQLSEGFKERGAITVGRSERDRFTILIVTVGFAELESPFGKMQLQYGQTILLPASLGACTVRPVGKPPYFEILTCIVP
jgi:mannose-6-phosphate isomerase